jgi:tryptophanyl-tRNA synthetase
VANQDVHDAYYCIVDLHALTLPWDPETLLEQTRKTAATLLAAGIHPSRSVLFVQSHVRAHTELAWVLTCLARMGELRRMTQFKDKSKGEGEQVGVGVFAYPVLMAADILLYQADGVPVGEDQRQHLELARDLAQRFNSRLGPVFTVPEAWIPEQGARIMSLDDPFEKMSTSNERDASKVLLIDPPEAIVKKIRAAVTDSGREVRAGADKPALTNLLTIYSEVVGTPVGELEARFAGRGYGEFKAALAEALVEHLRPIRERYLELMDDPAELDRLLAQGSEAASAVAERTLDEVRRVTGLGPRP